MLENGGRLLEACLLRCCLLNGYENEAGAAYFIHSTSHYCYYFELTTPHYYEDNILYYTIRLSPRDFLVAGDAQARNDTINTTWYHYHLLWQKSFHRRSNEDIMMKIFPSYLAMIFYLILESVLQQHEMRYNKSTSSILKAKKNTVPSLLLFKGRK